MCGCFRFFLPFFLCLFPSFSSSSSSSSPPFTLCFSSAVGFLCFFLFIVLVLQFFSLFLLLLLSSFLLSLFLLLLLPLSFIRMFATLVFVAVLHLDLSACPCYFPLSPLLLKLHSATFSVEIFEVVKHPIGKASWL